MRVVNGIELDDGVDEPDAYDWRQSYGSWHEFLYMKSKTTPITTSARKLLQLRYDTGKLDSGIEELFLQMEQMEISMYEARSKAEEYRDAYGKHFDDYSSVLSLPWENHMPKY